MINIEIFTEGPIHFPYKNIAKEQLYQLSNNICRHLKLANINISIIITDDNFIQNINKQYRKRDYPTDVISFAYRENSFPLIDKQIEELGDIYISIERAVTQANDYKVTLYDEIKRLLVHGILHLLGYDHEKSKEEKLEMQKKEDEILNIIN